MYKRLEDIYRDRPYSCELCQAGYDRNASNVNSG